MSDQQHVQKEFTSPVLDSIATGQITDARGRRCPENLVTALRKVKLEDLSSRQLDWDIIEADLNLLLQRIGADKIRK